MTAKTMKALLLKQHGGLEQLDVVADYPAPASAGVMQPPTLLA